MKQERSRNNQTQRIDRSKSNRLATVRNLPDTGEEGDEIYRGIPPEQIDRGDGFYKRVNGKWIFIGRYQEPTTPETTPVETERTYFYTLG